MSAPEHTAGPWKASIEKKPFATGGHWYVVEDAEGNGLGEFYGDDHEANVANVRIAAASPKLLEALRSAKAALEAQAPSNWQKVIAKADEAIAEARGEA